MDFVSTAPNEVPALVTASETFISRLVGVKGCRKGNTSSDAQHRSPSHEIRMSSFDLYCLAPLGFRLPTEDGLPLRLFDRAHS